jgi:hypothetical protein
LSSRKGVRFSDPEEKAHKTFGFRPSANKAQRRLKAPVIAKPGRTVAKNAFVQRPKEPPD